jgi:hypothetical protein
MKQVETPGQLALLRSSVEPVAVWTDQLLPPFVVVRIVPETPTAKQVEALGQVTLLSPLIEPELWTDQLAPPLVVDTTVPTEPTATHVDVLAQLTP